MISSGEITSAEKANARSGSSKSSLSWALSGATAIAISREHSTLGHTPACLSTEAVENG